MVKDFIFNFCSLTVNFVSLLLRAVVDSSAQLCAFSSAPWHALLLGEPKKTSQVLLQQLQHNQMLPRNGRDIKSNGSKDSFQYTDFMLLSQR